MSFPNGSNSTSQPPMPKGSLVWSRNYNSYPSLVTSYVLTGIALLLLTYYEIRCYYAHFKCEETEARRC